MIDKIRLSIKDRIGALFMVLFLVVLVFNATGCGNNSDVDLENGESQVEVPGETPGAVGEGTSVQVVEDGTGSDKMVDVALESIGRANPFLPSKEGRALAMKENLKYDLMEPPVTPQADEYAQKVVATKISGIMYDKLNPSAILNIENTDYLVRSGDVINGYKVLAISPSTVTVQLGANVYKAGVGQVVDNGTINYNTVSNLSNKFGGASGNNKK